MTAPAFIQRQRVLKRGFDEQSFKARLASQLPDVEKRRRADFVVQTGHGMAYTRRELHSIVRTLLRRPVAMKVAAFRHLYSEGLGSLAQIIEKAGGSYQYIDSYREDIECFDALAPDLLIITRRHARRVSGG